MKKKIIITVLILFFLSVAIYAGNQIFREYSEYHESADSYTDLEEYIKPPEAPETELQDTTEPTESGDEHVEEIVWPVVDFESLMAINSDCVAWIQIEGTEINYPVVQGEDNSYYLKHLFEGKWNSAGCIFLDSRVAADISDRHSIIYGHHMKNGTMFSGLTKYKKQDYFDAHPTGYLLTPAGNYQIEFFAGYVASTKDDAWELGFGSDEAFLDWANRAIEKSWFDSDITLSATDRIITLSTCSYEFDNARFVLLGRLKQ